MNHSFTSVIIEILTKHFKKDAETIFNLSNLLKYINYKTRSANRGSKSRSSYANLYALLALINDYKIKGYIDKKSGKYSKYEGADYTPLLKAIRGFSGGSKLQNHALNSRANDEYHKCFPDDERRPIIRKVDIKKYWINEQLLLVKISDKKSINIADAVIEIINTYAETKRKSFEMFINDCNRLKEIASKDKKSVIKFINDLIAPEKDARLFEIVSYAILKQYYADEIVFIGETMKTVHPVPLILYKTGRTNANDGGIDFVMKPYGKFFQVTETLDVKKYFLDIDKIEHYPIHFVVKNDMSKKEILKRLETGAREQYTLENIVDKYMETIEDVINITDLKNYLNEIAKKDKITEVLDVIIQWSNVEFNYVESDSTDHGTVTDDDEDEV